MGYISDSYDIPIEVRRQGTYLIGATGTGKTTLIKHMVADDYANGRPFALIDPHGDLSRDVADMAPPDRIRDVIYLDPAANPAVSFNVFDVAGSIDNSTAADAVAASIKYTNADSWGPRLNQILTHAVHLLLDSPGTNLSDITRVLNDPAFREQCIRRSKNEHIITFWTKVYANWNDRYRTEANGAVENKTDIFGTNTYLNTVLCRPSTINIAEIMNSRKILICNLSKRIGPNASHLLGAMLVTAFSQAAQARDTIPEDQRQDFTLYVDEFQNFATESFASILSEARKYRLNLVLSHQVMSQLPEGLRDTVLGNARTKIAFRVGPEDADILAAEFQLKDSAGMLRPDRLIGLADYHACINGKFIPTDPPQPSFGSLKRVQNNTAARYARP